MACPCQRVENLAEHGGSETSHQTNGKPSEKPQEDAGIGNKRKSQAYLNHSVTENKILM